MVKGETLTRAANQALKRKTTTERPVAAEGLTKVTTPDPKVTYQPVTWERQVTDPNTGNVLVIGTKPDGTHIALQKPIYDALHAAAGEGGTVVADVRSTKARDDRMFARNAAGETTGVGMPINVDQAKARIWARGAEGRRPKPGVLPEPGKSGRPGRSVGGSA